MKRWHLILAMQPPSVGSRRIGRPINRWSLHFDKFFEEVSRATDEHIDWTNMATDEEKWLAFEDAFVRFTA